MGLFGGKSDNAAPTVAAAPTRDRREAAPSVVSSEAPTVIGKDTFIKGEVRGATDMLIEGKVEGEIHGTRDIVGETGDVQARVVAQVLTVRGTVRGDCEASSKVEITATGKVFGNIAARAIVVAEGATFRGASKMAQPDPGKHEASRPDSATKTGAATSAAPANTTSSTSPG
ncbi:MAG: bactofilin family protein [Vicinamibacteria bacterium]